MAWKLLVRSLVGVVTAEISSPAIGLGLLDATGLDDAPFASGHPVSTAHLNNVSSIIMRFIPITHRLYWVLLGLSGSHLVLPGFTSVLLGFAEFLLGFMGLYWVFTEFYLVLLGFTGFFSGFHLNYQGFSYFYRISRRFS